MVSYEQLLINGHCTNTGSRMKNNHRMVAICINSQLTTCVPKFRPHRNSSYTYQTLQITIKQGWEVRLAPEYLN